MLDLHRQQENGKGKTPSGKNPVLERKPEVQSSKNQDQASSHEATLQLRSSQTKLPVALLQLCISFQDADRVLCNLSWAQKH